MSSESEDEIGILKELLSKSFYASSDDSDNVIISKDLLENREKKNYKGYEEGEGDITDEDVQISEGEIE